MSQTDSEDFRPMPVNLGLPSGNEIWNVEEPPLERPTDNQVLGTAKVKCRTKEAATLKQG